MKNIIRLAPFLLIVFTLASGLQAARADEIRIGGTGGGLGTMRILAESFAKANPDTKVSILPSLGSSGGIKAVMAGVIQVAVSSRDLKDAERNQGLVAVEYGRTPFVFATSVSSKIRDLTLSQLVDIYSGKIGQWPDGTRIRLVLRPIGDGDSELIRNMSPDMRQAKTLAEKRPGMPFAATDQENATHIESISGALGATSLAQIITEARQLRALSINGIQPTPANIANGSYPYFKSMYLITYARSALPVQRFVAFVQSSAGRKMLRRNGYWVR